MNGARALAILSDLELGKPDFTGKEVDELLKGDLAYEVNPDDFATLAWLEPIVREHADNLPITEPTVSAALTTRLAEIDERLKSDWHRFTTSAKHLREEEDARRALKRAIPVLGDKLEMDRLANIIAARARIAPEAKLAPCKALGDELFAITRRGSRVRHQLSLRLDRYKDIPLAAFLKNFDKIEGKMDAFSGEIAHLSNSIGYVKKNPHQVVIGLAKTGKPAGEALGTYHKALRSTGAPDVAVTLARNADANGGTDATSQRLQQAVRRLQHAGFPAIPAVFGAAKTLLPCPSIEAGVQRFQSIWQQLQSSIHPDQELGIKWTARLMPAAGEPTEIVLRVREATVQLRQIPSSFRESNDHRAVGVALASMVKTVEDVRPLVVRFRAVESELVRFHISSETSAPADALECVSCPGTPTEVAATVRALMEQVARAHGRAPNRADAAVAVAFAKRFAY